MVAVWQDKKTGKYVVDWYELDGIRKRRVVGKHKRIADVVQHEIEVRLERGKWGLEQKPKITLKEFASQFIDYCKAEKAPKTVKDYKSKIKIFADTYGDKQLSAITVRDIDTFKAKRLKAVSAGTVAGDLRTLNAFFNVAVKWDYLEQNPCQKVSKPRMVSENPPRFLTKEEVQSLIEAARDRTIFPMIATALYSGLRVSELIRLEWEDVDFDRGLINVKSKVEGHTKSHKARSVPVAPALRPILEKERKSRGYCFPAVKKARIYEDYRDAFQEVLKRAGLKGVGWHTLRHTFASHLVMADVNLRTIKELLGHSDIKTTMIYAHLAPDHLKNSVERLRF